MYSSARPIGIGFLAFCIIIIIIFLNPRKNEGGKKIKKSRKRFEVEN